MILGIVQARASSSRLPGKVFKKILDKPMIILELERIARSRRIEKLVLATSTEPSDDELASAVAAAGYDVYRGSLDDVLGRYYECAKKYGADHIVRLTGDCPLIDPVVIDAVIARHTLTKADYSSNTLGEETFPDGLDCEVMTFAALEDAYNNARLASEREHVTPYIRNNDEFKKTSVSYMGKSLNSERWTVDEERDFSLVTAVYKALYPEKPDFNMVDVLDFLNKNPEIHALNRGITRNEGLAKSIASDHLVK